MSQKYNHLKKTDKYQQVICWKVSKETVKKNVNKVETFFRLLRKITKWLARNSSRIYKPQCLHECYPSVLQLAGSSVFDNLIYLIAICVSLTFREIEHSFPLQMSVNLLYLLFIKSFALLSMSIFV